MLTEELIKEELSYAYVHAVAARAGYSCQKQAVDRDSIDVEISASGKVAEDSLFCSPKLAFQLKASSIISLSEKTFSFDLPVNNYNALRGKRVVPAYLLVLVMPTDKTKWLSLTEDEIITRKCVYWYSLLNAPETSNSEKIRIHIPRLNVFTMDALINLMSKAAKQEYVIYEK